MAIPCESSITHVHVFARGARVTRRAVPTGAVADGEVTLSLDGLPTPPTAALERLLVMRTAPVRSRKPHSRSAAVRLRPGA